MGYSVGINQLWLDEWEQMKKTLYSVSLTVKRDMQAQMDIPPAPLIFERFFSIRQLAFLVVMS